MVTPSAAAFSVKARMRSGMPGRCSGDQPVPARIARSSAPGLLPPTKTGMGSWIGLGHDQMRSKLTKSPWKVASSLRQISRIARTRSSSSS